MDDFETAEPGPETAVDAAALDLSALRASLAEHEVELSRRDEHERALAARLRSALAATDPALDPALIAGESLDEIETSYAAAKATLARVREALAHERQVAVPAGAPGRAGELPASAFEKIRRGIGTL